MAKKTINERVSPVFSEYLNRKKKFIKDSSGIDVSKADITMMIAVIDPVIKIEQRSKNKRNSIFDF